MTTLARTWLTSSAGQHFLKKEAIQLSKFKHQICGPSLALCGDFFDVAVPHLFDYPHMLHFGEEENPVLCAEDWQHRNCDFSHLPIESGTLSCLIAPHIIENNDVPHNLLNEFSRVLRDDGYLIISGFHPYSLVGAQRFFQHNNTLQGRYYTYWRIMDWLKLLNFDIVASKMCQYAPLLQSDKLTRGFAFLESIGDRWFPLLGGSYTIIAKKRTFSGVLVGQTKKRNKKTRATAIARMPSTHNKKTP